MKLIEILGNSQKLDGGAMFGNAPKALWSKWLTPDEQNRITLACRALLVLLDDGRKILLEAGIGNFFDPKLKDRYGVVEADAILLQNLAKHGIQPADIDAVILSHLHFDHAGGLLSSFDQGANQILFSKAKFYVGESHWQRAQNPHARDRASFLPELNQLLESSGRLNQVSGSTHADFPGWSFHFSEGHTPGLMLTEIPSPQGPLVFAADLIPGLAWMHVPISMGYDRYPELLIDEKQALLSDLLKRNGSVYFTHDPHVVCAEVTQDAKGKFSGIPKTL